MAQGVIYMVDGDGLKRMTPSAPESEDRMQALVARYPELITDGDGDLLLIRREAPVGDGESDGRWSLDHLFVTREGVPVLVELKRAVDTRLRREVVGQMLDYAANATAHWGAGTIARSFAAAATGLDEADTRLSEFIGEREPDEFWRVVDGNLAAGRIKLVFVADAIPRELALIVEFLNGQMRADVRAVELRWFSGDGGITTLSPRVIGETERTAAGKRAPGLPQPIEMAEWINTRLGALGDAAVRGAWRFTDLVEAMGGRAVVTDAQASMVAQVALSGGKAFYPLQVSAYGRLKLMLVWLKSYPPFRDENARRKLYDEFASIVGPLHTASLAGGPGCDVTMLLDDEIARRVGAFSCRMVEVVRTAREIAG